MSAAEKKQTPNKKEGRREINKREKKQRLVAAARTLFRINGYEETTTQQIAKAADIATGTLFLYAKSKGDLLLLVFKDELREVIEKAWRAIPKDQPLPEQIMALFDGNISYHKQDLATAKALMRELVFLDNPDRKDDILAAQDSVLEKLTLLFSEAQDKGAIRANANPRIAAECVFSIYHEQLQIWLSGMIDYDDFHENLLRRINFVLEGVST